MDVFGGEECVVDVCYDGDWFGGVFDGEGV